MISPERLSKLQKKEPRKNSGDFRTHSAEARGQPESRVTVATRRSFFISLSPLCHLPSYICEQTDTIADILFLVFDFFYRVHETVINHVFWSPSKRMAKIDIYHFSLNNKMNAPFCGLPITRVKVLS